MDFIDYSQYKIWSKCPWAWYWRYIQGYQRKYTGQRKDALCLGSLVHDGLENWGRNQLPSIRDNVVEEMTPTPETLSSARELVEEYARLYPNEEWELHRFEEPLKFPLDDKYSGLAKVDAYFYNEAPCQIESGLPGYELTLSPGWWIREYKTKDATSNRANWNQNWEVNMQASFQMLALQAHIGEPVQGVLVSVLEKPKLYIPKRKCKGCGDQYEMGLYIYNSITELYQCPACSVEQKLSAYEPKVRAIPQFYRLVAVRNEQQLIQAKSEIYRVMLEMALIEGPDGPYRTVPTRENCVHPIYGLCEYYKLDNYGLFPEDDENLEKKDPVKYLKIEGV